jgi:hypothetical protein
MLYFNESKVTINKFYTNYIDFYTFYAYPVIICLLAAFFSLHLSSFGPPGSGSETLIIICENYILCREENGQEVTMVFDCKNAGLKNLDMEFIQFVIGMFLF